jgi:hypothetical protein
MWPARPPLASVGNVSPVEGIPRPGSTPSATSSALGWAARLASATSTGSCDELTYHGVASREFPALLD